MILLLDTTTEKTGKTVAEELLSSGKTETDFEWVDSFGNKLTGLLLFLLPLSVYIAEVRYGATLVCAVATVTVIKEIVKKEGSCR